MERRIISEENVTMAIIKWLTAREWYIICYDFPQSGTGKLLLPNNNSFTKNKGAITPDIVAVKNSTCIFMENKNRFHKNDFLKVNSLIHENNYTNAINNLLSEFDVNTIFYGIGLPTCKYRPSHEIYAPLVDFIIGVNDNFSIKMIHNPINLQ